MERIGLPDEAVEALTRWRCDRCGETWSQFLGVEAIGPHIRRDGVECEGGPVSRTSLLPAGVYVSDGKGNVTPVDIDEIGARAAIRAALSATDTVGSDATG